LHSRHKSNFFVATLAAELNDLKFQESRCLRSSRKVPRATAWPEIVEGHPSLCGIDAPRIKRARSERGTIILLVAVVMLFVVGAMAALSIDVVTLYTARSEAQLVADATALAFARVIANSGATSDQTGGSWSTAWATATTFATNVALQNQIAGIALSKTNLTFSAAPTTGTVTPNPTITVAVSLNTLPTFFARIWGTTSLTVAATATAEVYNPSTYNGTAPPTIHPPVAPLCVKPWLLPNIDPSTGGSTEIFDPTSGTVQTTTLLGWNSANPANTAYLQPATYPATLAWKFYQADPAVAPFQPPTSSLPSCVDALTTNYEHSIAGCIPAPVSCSLQAVQIDTFNSPNRATDTYTAANCLTHAVDGNTGDQVDTTNFPNPPPFEFTVGSGNPAVLLGLGPTAGTTDVMVSDSLVTVPVFDTVTFNAPPGTANIVGFVQLFLNADGNPAPEGAGINAGINTTVVNLVGCGTGLTGNPIIGNGATAVAVRLISPPATTVP
jgi:hypothetical protein